MIEVAISPGPSTKANVAFWRDPRRVECLIVRRRLGGCAAVLGASLLAIAALLERSILTGDPEWVSILFGLLIGGAGSITLFGSVGLVFDRRRRVVMTHFALIATFERSSRSIAGATALRIDEVVSGGGGEDDNRTTSFVLKLELSEGSDIEIASSGTWESLVPVAEGVGAFLELPVYDYVVDTLRAPDELDQPLLERERKPETPSRQSPPDVHIEISTPIVRLTFPPPDARVIYVMAAVVGLCWTLPLVLSGNLVTSLLPLLVLTWSWFYVRFGLRSSIEIEGPVLRVVRHGLLVDRIHEFDSSQLEDLAVRSPEWGGSRNVVAHLTAGYIVARSDTRSARFGWGLSKSDLSWLRAYVVRALEPPKVATPKRIPEDDIPTEPPVCLAPLAGLFVGAFVARLLGGRLELCLAIPFLEHIINVGGLIGLVIALWISQRSADGRKGRTAPRLLAWGALALMAGAVFVRSHPLLQPFPTFDERMLARLPHPSLSFWFGWTVSATLPNVIAATLAVGGWTRFRRGKRRTDVDDSNATTHRKPADPGRQERLGRLLLFLFGTPFFLGGIFVLFDAFSKSGSERLVQVLAGLVFLIPGLALMQAWKLVPKRLWPKGVDWNAMIGVLAAGGAGTFIIGMAFLGDESQMNAPRFVVAAAGAIFLFAGVAILPQAIPRLARTTEWIGRLAVALLLTCFAIVALGVVLEGALIFVLGLIITAGMAAVSWYSLFKEWWRAWKE